MDQICHQVAIVHPKTYKNYVTTPMDTIPTISPLGTYVKIVCASLSHRTTSSGTRIDYTNRIPNISSLPDRSNFDVSGIIEKLGHHFLDSGLKIGQRVIVHPEGVLYEDGGCIVVPNVEYVVPIPENLSFCVASMLPSEGLLAKTAISFAKKQIKSCHQKEHKILVVGTEGVSFWAIQISCQQFTDGKVQIFVASRSDEGFCVANGILRGNVIDWDEKLYEEQLIERTINACDGLLDVVIDFGASPRSLQRSLQCLKEGGVVLISGEDSDNLVSKFSVKAEERGQSILVVPKGSVEQLEDLVRSVVSGEIDPPPFTVFPSNSASEVVQKLSNSEIYGCAVLRFNNIQ